LFTSSNALTWTAQQDADLTFRLVAASFSAGPKTVAMGSATVAHASDLIVQAGVSLPTADAAIHFTLTRADGSVINLNPGQPWSLAAYANETVVVAAVLTGTTKVSPVLYPAALLVAGSLQASGTYVSDAFPMGTAIRMSSFIDTVLPAGSGLTVEVDNGSGVWTPVAQYAAVVQPDGSVDREYRADPYTAAQGRLRLTLTGTPAARPTISALRAVAI
jgi:hypothetical protein